MIKLSILLAATFVTFCSQAAFQEMTIPAQLERWGQTYGASWGDYNGDGFPDVWIGNHADTPSLFLNKGDGTFIDIVNSVWPGNLGDTHGASWIDFDNDGDQDLLEVVGGTMSNHLFVNEGGIFFERAADYGIDSPGARSRSSTWIDWNRDGFLDVLLSHALGADSKPYIFTNTGSFFFDAASDTGIGEHDTDTTYIADISEDNVPDIILSSGNPNSGPIYDTTTLPFADLVSTLNIPGTQNLIGCSDSVIADFNGDLRNDIFSVCGGGGREVVQRNDYLLEMKIASVSNETAVEFHSAAPLTISIFPNFVFEPVDHLRVGSNSIVPVIVPHPELGWRSFSFDLDPQDSSIYGTPVHIPGTDLGFYVSFDDTSAVWRLALSTPAGAQLSIVINGTGTIDNVTTDGFSPTPPVYWPLFNVRAAGGFEDRRIQSGLGLPLPCPSAAGGDFDNDMDVDIYLVCSRTISNLPNKLFLNDGNGNFVLESNAGGASGSLAGSGDAVVTADYDRDGYLDLLVTNGGGGAPFYNGPNQLFRNMPNGNKWLEIDLVGSTSNRDAIGAIVVLHVAGISQMRTQDGGFHRRSQNHKRLHFGLAQNSMVSEVEVRWPSGKVDTFFNIPANRIITINESGNPDLDGDGVLDIADNCINDENPVQENIDFDEYGDACDAFPLDPNETIDSDGDGVGDNTDKFPLDPVESIDSDNDGVGNVADLDDDNDGVVDTLDDFPLDSAESVDTDNDGTGNNSDIDDDNDGVLDINDAFPLDPAKSTTETSTSTEKDSGGSLNILYLMTIIALIGLARRKVRV